LKWLFEDCGEIVSARVATDKETGKPRGFGHVDFASTEAVDKAMTKAGTDLYGRPIRVDFGGRTQGGNGGFGGKGGKGGFGKGGKGGFGGKGKGGFGKGKGKGANPGFAANKGSIVDFTGSKVTFDDDDE
jgi:nucleolin